MTHRKKIVDVKQWRVAERALVDRCPFSCC